MSVNEISLAKPAKKTLSKRIIKYIPFYIMALPGLAYLFINNYLPMAGLQIAFKDFKYDLGIWGSKWCGFDNFKALFATNDAWTMTRNTILYNLAFILINMVAGIAAALFIDMVKNKFAKQSFQTIILLPYLMSWVVVSYLAYAFLAGDTGFINKSIINALGLNSINFYQESKYWPFILIFFNTWKGLGYGAIIYLSTIVGISKDYYEAAVIDGATKWQQIRFITLPLLKGTVVMLFILSLGMMMRSDFGLFYQLPMDQGVLYDVTQTIDTYVYRGLMVNNTITLSAAASFYQSIVGFILVVASNALVKKISSENSLF